ncbi:hypothetical protein [Rhodoflexus caldus]|uniref:hypothetical protein n=1 Tax=Rhodoflexus caldus TaxID=2891236 RepID=UPI00202A3B80|nr:hypothetical protein [Rhodoflexus caldus]
MDDAEKQLRAYLSKLLSIEDSKKIVLAEADLERISLELGVSWQDVKTIRDRHLQKAESFLKNGLFSEAIAEFNECMVLHPNLQAAVLGLAKACYGKWFAQPTAENRQAAVAAIRSAIDLFPAEQEPYQLLKTIQLPPAIPTAPKDTPQKAWALIAVLLVAVLLAVAVVFVARQSSPVPVESPRGSTPMPSTPAAEVPAQVEEAPTSAAVPAPKSGVSKKETPPTTTAEPTPQIGVFFDESLEKSLDFQLENSELSLYPGSYAYKLTGYFQVKNAEIEKLKIRIEGLDENGKVLFTQYRDAAGSLTSGQTFRPDDLIPFDFLLYKEGENSTSLRSVRLMVQEMRKEDAAPSYAAAQPIEIIWNFEKSPNINLAAAVRESRFSEYSLGKKGTTHHYVLEFKNTGNRHLSQVKFAVEYLDKNGKSLDLHERYAVVASGAKLRRGQVRLYHGVYIIDNLSPDKVAGFRLRIVEAQ